MRNTVVERTADKNLKRCCGAARQRNEAQALAIVAASLGPEQFEGAQQNWLRHWNATDTFSPGVEANWSDLMGEAAEKLCTALAKAGFDVLVRMGPRWGAPIIR
jgi:hypothetical protein